MKPQAWNYNDEIVREEEKRNGVNSRCLLRHLRLEWNRHLSPEPSHISIRLLFLGPYTSYTSYNRTYCTGTRTEYLRFLAAKTKPFMDFGARAPKYWVLKPSGYSRVEFWRLQGQYGGSTWTSKVPTMLFSSFWPGNSATRAFVVAW